jgi:hypothetical protein
MIFIIRHPFSGQRLSLGTFRKVETATKVAHTIQYYGNGYPLEIFDGNHVAAWVDTHGTHTRCIYLRQIEGTYQTFIQHGDGTTTEGEIHPDLEAAGKALSGLLQRHLNDLPPVADQRVWDETLRIQVEIKGE